MVIFSCDIPPCWCRVFPQNTKKYPIDLIEKWWTWRSMEPNQGPTSMILFGDDLRSTMKGYLFDPLTLCSHPKSNLRDENRSRVSPHSYVAWFSLHHCIEFGIWTKLICDYKKIHIPNHHIHCKWETYKKRINLYNFTTTMTHHWRYRNSSLFLSLEVSQDE